MEQVQSDADLIKEGSIKQWEELELIRVIAERDAESGISDKAKETGRWKESRSERVDALRRYSLGNIPSSMRSSACAKS